MIFTVVGLIALSLLSTVLASSREARRNLYTCPTGFVPHGSKCYAYISRGETWQSAQATCTAISSHLVEIRSADELYFVSHFAQAQGRNVDVWLGGNDLVREGFWSWAWSGSAVTFNNWAREQPDNYKGSENCMEIWHKGGWNDEECGTQKFFICEKSA